jgi:3-deoxy-D-manno-octulosonic-acid transferase
MGIVYRVLSYAAIGAAMPLLMMHPKLRTGLGLRFGRYPADPRPWPKSRGSGPRIWLHGASAGDLIALLPVMHEIRRALPEATLIVSTMTNSGFAIASERVRPHADAITYVPWDLPGATRRAMEAIRPDLLVLEYAEIWPNLIAAARRIGARIAVTNGRFSERLIGRYRWFYRLIGNPLEEVDLLLMREEVEASRALALGAPRERVIVTGNTKFDNVSKVPSEETIAKLKGAFAIGEEPILVAGSTHEGEERSLAIAFIGMRAVAPDLRLIVAPRYVERAHRVASLLRAEGLSVALRSEAKGEHTDVLVLDTIGELTSAYALARLVFVGGSFVTRGGQNILEPAGIGRPVLFGPHMMNFRDSVEVLLGRGGIQVQTPEQLEEIGRELLQRPDEISRLGEMAKAAVQKVSGASRRNAEALAGLLKRR